MNRIDYPQDRIEQRRPSGTSSSRELRRDLRRVEIPFEFKNNFLVLDVVFDKRVPLKFILDTGAEHTLLTQKTITDLLGIPYQRKFTVQGADLTQYLVAYLIRNIHLQVENVRASNHSLLVLEEDYFRFEDFTGMNIQGIIGADFFRGYTLQLDYQKQVITLVAAHLFDKVAPDYIQLPIEINRGKPYLQTQVTLQDTITTPVKLLLDTGASVSLLLNVNTDTLLQLPATVIPARIGRGLGGDLEGHLGRVNLLKIGTYKLQEIVTNFQDIPDLVRLEDINYRNGIIGNEIMSRFSVIIDYARSLLYLKPNKQFDKAFECDKSGLQMLATGQYLNDFVVQYILPDSPAAEAGIAVGDRVVAINGIGVGFLSLEGLTNRLKRKAGKKIRLKIRRNGEKRRLTFYLRELI
ncbi:MAG: aspartyl protease family protein [Bacteroidota bacterium]